MSKRRGKEGTKKGRKYYTEEQLQEGGERKKGGDEGRDRCRGEKGRKKEEYTERIKREGKMVQRVRVSDK